MIKADCNNRFHCCVGVVIDPRVRNITLALLTCGDILVLVSQCHRTDAGRSVVAPYHCRTDIRAYRRYVGLVVYGDVRV